MGKRRSVTSATELDANTCFHLTSPRLASIAVVMHRCPCPVRRLRHQVVQNAAARLLTINPWARISSYKFSLPLTRPRTARAPSHRDLDYSTPTLQLALLLDQTLWTCFLCHALALDTRGWPSVWDKQHPNYGALCQPPLRHYVCEKHNTNELLLRIMITTIISICFVFLTEVYTKIHLISHHQTTSNTTILEENVRLHIYSVRAH